MKCLTSFMRCILLASMWSRGGIDYARELLEKALGAARAEASLSRLASTMKARPSVCARKTDPNQLLNFIQMSIPKPLP